jgi:tripartite-type tricarboxylate transporter receptor subunit TctC
MKRAASILALSLLSAGAFAQSYPAKPIRWIIPFAPGGGLDSLTRVAAPVLSNQIGQPVVPENRASASGVVGADLTAKSPPDGYTILTAGNDILVFGKLVNKRLPYDPEKDFAPVIIVANAPIVLYVHESIPANTVKEFIAYAKKNPGRISYGSAGIGHPFHLAMEMLEERAGLFMVHIPYKGTAQVQQDFAGGRIHAMFSASSPGMVSMVKTGKAKALATATRERMATWPGVPTLDESGIKNFEAGGWFAVVAPAGTPKDVVSRLNRELATVLKGPEMAKLYASFSFLPGGGTPEDLGQRISREIRTWGPLVQSLKIETEQ